MKLTADQYYYVYFCMLEEPAMFMLLLCSSEFVSIRQPLVLSTDNASFKAINITLWLFLTPMGLNFNPEPGQKST